ncbi:MAG: SPOR domain-containing protein [Litorivicinus sp.]
MSRYWIALGVSWGMAIHAFDPGVVIDADNPFARSLEGSARELVAPADLRQRLRQLDSLDEGQQQPAELAEEQILTNDELKDLRLVLQALQAPAQPTEAIDRSTLPAQRHPADDYILTGIMVSFAEDRSAGSEFALGESAADVPDETVHLIRGLETLDSIAALYGSTRSAIEQANGLRPGAVLTPGTPVIVPQNRSTDQQIQRAEFQLQLGAYSSDAKARQAIGDFSARHASILTGDRFRVLEPENLEMPLWRVLVGPYASNLIATNKCTLLKQEGASCLIRESVRALQPASIPQSRPTYVAVLREPGNDGAGDIIVSEGDRLGLGGVVVSIFKDRLIVQENGVQKVLSLAQRRQPPPAPPPPPPSPADPGTTTQGGTSE